jgi:hypothetical protein
MARFPLISENSVASFNGPWSAIDNIPVRDFMVLAETIGYAKTKFLMLESMLRQLTANYGVDFYVLFPKNIPSMPTFTDLARDLTHGGKDFNEFLAKYIWSNISI